MRYVCTNSPIPGRQYSIGGRIDRLKITLEDEPALEGACVLWLDHYFWDFPNRKYILHTKTPHHHLGVGLCYHYYAESVDPEANEHENNIESAYQESVIKMEEKPETKRVPFIVGEPVIFADIDADPPRMFRGTTVGEGDVMGVHCMIVEFVGEAKNVYAETHGIFPASSLYFPKRIGSCP